MASFLFPPIKHLHASCFPTPVCLNYVYTALERGENIVSFTCMCTHTSIVVCLRPCRCLLSTDFMFTTFPTMDSWSQAWKYTKKKTNNGLPFESRASLYQSAARESRMETWQPAFWQGLLRFPWFLAWTHPPLHMSLNGRMWLIH